MITGIGGAIGIHLFAHIMHNTDWFVVGLDSYKADHKGYFDRVVRMTRDHPEWKERLQLVAHDLNAPLTKRQAEVIGHIDYLVNLASRSDVQNSIEDPLPFVRNNTELMLNILEYAREYKPEVFLHFSTDEVYGPAPRDSEGHKEWEPIVPSNPYSASKACQEALAIAWWRSYELPLIITNTMNNFGEMQAPSKYPAMIQNKVENGEIVKVHAAKSGEIGTRYYIHSRNTADAVLFILQNVQPHIHTPGEIDLPVRLNIVGDAQVDNLELAQTIANLMEKPLNYEMTYFHEDNPGHDLHYGLNGDKLASLGWESPLSFEESLKNTIEWQRRNPEWMK